jgi:hypothetical protein
MMDGMGSRCKNFLLFFTCFLSACQTDFQATPLQVSVGSSTPPAASATEPIPTLTPTPSPTHTQAPTATPLPSFSFAVFGDSANHNGAGEFDTPHFFRGVVESISRESDTAFTVGVGDLTPVEKTDWTIRQVFGANYIWFPLVGNHDLWPSDMIWLRTTNFDLNGKAPPNIVRRGPPDCEETTYSFDYANTHFVMLNVYCDILDDIRTDGAIVDSLYEWLANDLASTQQEHIFLFGHEPAYPLPDKDTGIVRHLDDSLDKYPITRDRFWKLLSERKVRAYITGHTHSFSAVRLDGVWQVDVGHAMGIGQQANPATFVIFRVEGSKVFCDTYRGGVDGQYSLHYSEELD